MSVGVRPFRSEDESALRRVMVAALEVDGYPGFNATDLDARRSRSSVRRAESPYRSRMTLCAATSVRGSTI